MAIPTHYLPPIAATPIEQLLQTMRNIGPMPPADEQLVRETYRARAFARHQYLHRAGEACPCAVYIAHGVFREFHTDANNAEHTTRLAFDDYFTGDQQSLFSGEPSSYAIQCLEDAEGLTLDKAGYEHLFAHSTTFGEFFRFRRNRSFNITIQQMADRATKSAEQRYRELMRENPQIFQRVALKHIASCMGVTPETLSRIRKSIAF